MSDVVVVAMSDDEFEKAKEELKKIFADIKNRILGASKILARMSPSQRREIGKIVRISQDWVERLSMVGLGILPEWIGQRDRFLPAGVLRSLPEEKMKELWNPKKEVEILTSNGSSTAIVCKSLESLDLMEQKRAIKRKVGVVPPEKQFAFKSNQTKTDKDCEDAETFESARLCSDKVHILVYFREGSRGKIPISALRKFLK